MLELELEAVRAEADSYRSELQLATESQRNLEEELVAVRQTVQRQYQSGGKYILFVTPYET